MAERKCVECGAINPFRLCKKCRLDRDYFGTNPEKAEKAERAQMIAAQEAANG